MDWRNVTCLLHRPFLLKLFFSIFYSFGWNVIVWQLIGLLTLFFCFSTLFSIEYHINQIKLNFVMNIINWPDKKQVVFNLSTLLLYYIIPIIPSSRISGIGFQTIDIPAGSREHFDRIDARYEPTITLRIIDYHQLGGFSKLLTITLRIIDYHQLAGFRIIDYHQLGGFRRLLQ